MRRIGLGPALCAIAALLAGCGGDDGGNGPILAGNPAPTPGATPAPTTAACSLASRQAWARNALEEWYLFPENIAAGVQPAGYSTVDAYVDALVAPARALGRDRYFTYLTSIAEENAYYEQGASAGFGFRLSYTSSTVRVTEAFEGGSALAAGIDRGTEIQAIGTSQSDMQTVSSLIYNYGTAGVIEALGPDTPGTTRILRIGNVYTGTRDVTLTKGTYALDPVSDRYGVKIIDDGGQRVGYLNLRTFISTAEPDLVTAFAYFKANGITRLIVDLRYNGGGLVSTAQVLGNLMGGGLNGRLFGRISYRASKSGESESFNFVEQPESIKLDRVAFIGTRDTASASELIINAFAPYLGDNMALVGTNTYGKPVGQIALDQPACDDRLRTVAFAIENAAGQGAYYNGLAATLPRTCSEFDDIAKPFGDPQEMMVLTALNFVNGRGCFPISAAASATASSARVGTPARPTALVREVPRSTIERELPGAF